MNESVEYVIRVVLKARDQLAATLAGARAEIEAFEESARRADDALGGRDGLNSKITALNTRATAAAEKLGRLKKQTDEYGGSVRDLITGEGKAADASEKRGKAIEGASMTEIRATGAARRSREETEKGTASAKQSAAAIRQSAKEKAAETRAINEHAKALGLDAKAESNLDNELKERQKTARAASVAFKSFDREFKAAIAAYGEDSDVVKENRAEHEKLAKTFEDAKDAREATRTQLSELRKEHRAIIDQARAEIEAGKEAVKVEEETEGAVKKTTTAKRQRKTATKEVVAEVKEDTKAIEDNTAVLKENADAEDVVISKKKYRKTVIAAGRPPAPGTPEARAAVERAKASREGPVRPATDDDLQDLLEEHLGGFGGLSGGAPRGRSAEEAISKERVARIQKEKEEVAGLKGKYEDFQAKVAGLQKEWFDGDRTFQSLAFHIDEVAKSLDRMSRRAAGLTTPFAQKFADEVQRQKQSLLAISDPKTDLNQAIAKRRVEKGIDEAPFERVAQSTRTLGRDSDRAVGAIRKTEVAAGRTGRAVRKLGDDERDAARAAETLGEHFRHLSERIDRTGGGVAALDNRLRGLLVLGVIAFSQQLITALLGIGGALTSVASSAIFAGGALGGIFAAGIAQALPVMGLFVASASRMKEVMDAVQQSQLVDMQSFQRRDNNQKKTADTADAVANAEDGVAAAEDRVSQAHRDLTDKQKALTQAREDAKQKLLDLTAAEHDAQLQAMGAAKSQADAQDALRQAVASGDVSGLGGAELDVLQTTQQRRESVAGLATARKDLGQARRRGVERDPGVVAAKRDVGDARKGIVQANDAVTKSTRALEKAQRGSATAATDQFSGMEKLQWLLQKRLSPAERELYDRINVLQKTYKENFRGVTDILTNEYTRYVNTANRLLKDPEVLKSAKGLSTGLAGSMERVRKEFSSNQFIRQLLRIIGQARKDLGPLTSIIINLGHAFANIAEDAGPALHRLLNYFKDITGEFRHLTEDRAGVTSFFDRGEKHLEAWLDALKAIIIMFGTLAGIGEASGMTMIQDLTKQVQEWTADIRGNRGDVAQFFEDSRKSLYTLLGLGQALVKSMFEVFNPERMQLLADFLENTLLPAFVDAVKLVGGLTTVLLTLLNLPGVSTLVQIVTVMLLVSKTVTTTSLLVQGLVDHLGKFFRVVESLPGGKALTGKIDDIARAFGGVITKVGELIKRIPGLSRVGDAISGVGTKIGRTRVPTGDVTPDGTPGRGGGTLAGTTGRETPEERRRRQAEEERTRTARRTTGGRARRIGRGVGLAGLIGAGAYGLSQGQNDFRDAHQGIGLAVDQLSGFAQQATSFNIGGAFKTLFGGTTGKEFEQFAKSFDTNVKRMTAKGDIDGLQKLSDRAKDLAKEFPLYSDSLNDAAKASGDAAEALRRLGDLPPVLRQAFRKNKVQAADIADKNAAAQFLDNLHRLRTGGSDTIKDLRSNLLFNIDKITQGFKSGSKEATEGMTSSFSVAFRDLKRMARDGTITHGQYMKEMARLTKQQMQYMRDNMSTMSAEAKGRFADNMHQATQAAIAEAGGINNATEKALKHIRRLMDQEFQAYGLDPESARRLARNRTTAGRHGIDQFGRSSVVGSGSGKGGASGFLGQMGERGADLYHMVLGRGEAVLNWAHQKVVNSALWNQYGMTLPGLFKSTNARHGVEYPGGAGMAKGGSIVPIAGQGGNGTPAGVEYINSSIKPLVESLLRKYHLLITDAFDPTGRKHKSPGHEVTGTAVDFVPGTGGSWPMLEAMGRWAVNKGLIVGYDSHIPGAQNWPDHGRGNHIHVEFQGGGTPVRGVLDALKAIKQIKTPLIKGGGEYGLSAQLGVNAVTLAANTALKNAVNSADSGPHPGGTPIPAFHGPWVQVMQKIAAAKHWSLAAWRWLVNAESGGHVSIRNPSSGAFGLGQFLGGTLRAYAKYGATSPTGEGQIRAMAQYISDRYGNPDKAKTFHLAHNWYDRGGIIGGALGRAVPVVAHAGEWILNKGQQWKAAAAAGLSVEELRKMLGFSGGPRSFAAGGTVQADQATQVDFPFTTAFERSRRSNIRLGAYALPTLPIRDWQDLIKEVKRVASVLKITAITWRKGVTEMQHEISQIHAAHKKDIAAQIAVLKKGGVTDKERTKIEKLRHEELSKSDKDRIAQLKKNIDDLQKNRHNARRLYTEQVRLQNVDAITREGGIVDQLEAVRQRRVTSRGRATTFAQFALHRVAGALVGVNRLDPTQVADRNLDAAGASVDDIGAQENLIRASQAVVQRRLRQLRRGGVKQNEAAQVRKLETQLSKLNEQFQSVRDAAAEALSSFYQAQVDAQQAAIDKINSDAEKSTAANSILSRVATAVGNNDWLRTINAAQRDVLTKQADDLAGRIQAARDIGNNTLADQLQQQVDDLRTQVFESIQQDLQAAADNINNTAQRALGRADLFNRMSDAMGKVGLDAVVNIGGQLLSRRGVFQQRQDALLEQRTGLQGVLRDANAQGNIALIQSLTDQLADLDVQIQENTKALFDARVTDVNRVEQQAGQVIDYRKQILELQGAISGVTDIAGELALEQERTGALNAQRAGLEGLLSEAVAAQNDQAVIDLTNQLYENQIALLTNTQAINELNGTTQGPQSFTSSAWQWFREAIFTGMGGVMPQYVVPGAASGGIVTKSGLVYVHTGEPIQPASILPADFGGGGGDHIETHIHSVDGEVPMTELVANIAWAKKTANVQRGQVRSR